MSKLVIFTTGGTVASKPSPQSGLYTAGAMTADELLGQQSLSLDMPVIVEEIAQISSSAMSFDILQKLIERIKEHRKDPDVTGFVITHGTDTMEESAYFLSLCLDEEGEQRPVILTGAQRTPQEEGSDAYTNIRDALLAVSSQECRGLGVSVLFNENIYSARYVRKAHSFNPDAFSSFGFGMLGYVDGGVVYIAQRPANRECYSPVGPIPRVDIFKAYLGCDGNLIRASVASGAKGIILEGFGRGHLPPEACDAVSEATAAGIAVIITTTCEMGRVQQVYDFTGSVADLEKRGAIPGFDYAPKKARIKLGVLLASGISDTQALREAFSR